MKTLKKSMLVVLSTTLLISSSLYAQEDSTKESPFSVGTDIVTSYVWRGTKYSGPAFQPCIEYGVGGLTIGSWGSFGFTDQVAEADLYLSYGFDFGLSLGLTDYYYQGNDYFKYTDTTASHAFEVNLGYETGGFSLGANYILNDAHAGGPANSGGDMYFELGYGFKNLDVFVGAGNGWHTSDGEFGLCNIGIGTSKDIKITDSYSLPVSGQVVLNPERKEFNIVVGISF